MLDRIENELGKSMEDASKSVPGKGKAVTIPR